jgi:hypothetical protein
MRAGLVFAGIVLAAAGAGPALGQSAGVIQFVAGEVTLVRPGASERSARKGVAVNVGDTLSTADGGLVQLKMGDGAIVVVSPESRVTVAEFHYAGVEDGTEKVRYRLEQGGFRAVTGAIGRTHKKNYLIETPIAHMGVRGTDHESYYFPTTAQGSGDGAKPGAYNKVNTGKTFIRTGAGEVEIEANQVGFVASANDVPVILPAVPGFFNRSVAPRNARPAVAPAPAPNTLARVDQTVETLEGVNMVEASGPSNEAGAGDVHLVGYAVRAGNSAVSFGRSGNGVEVADNGVVPVTGSGPYGVNWKSWAGGRVTVGGSATVGTTHMIESTRLTTATQLAAMPALVTASYAYAGGPAPTNGFGVPGAIKALDVEVNFSTQQITRYSLQASALADWNAQGSGSIANFTGTVGIPLGGSCSGCTPGAGSPAASGTAHGAFVGPAAEGMITSFGLSAVGQSLSGSAYLER